MKWIKNYWKEAVLLCGSVSTILVLTEACLRFTSLVNTLPNESLIEGYYVPNNERVYDIARNVSTTTHSFSDGNFDVWSNNLGCYDGDFFGEKPYVFLTGDSFTWGYTRFNAKWGVVLENALNKRVLKCGVAGYGTHQQLLKMSSLMDELPSPEIVVVGHFANDIRDDINFLDKDPNKSIIVIGNESELKNKYCTTTYPENPNLQRIKCILHKNSILYHMFKSIVSQRTGSKVAPITNLELEYHIAQLRDFRDLSKSIESKFITVLFPSKESVYSGVEDESHESLKKNLDLAGIEYFDVTEYFRKAYLNTQQQFYWKTDGHWNELGNELAGLLVAQYLLTNDYLEYKKELLYDIETQLIKKFSI